MSYVRTVILCGVIAIVALGTFMVRRAEGRTNKIALASSPQPVTVVPAKRSTYRPTRTFGGTFASWNSVDVGPQRVSAYVQAVLVRPGSVVKKGDVLATLDCGAASATSKAVAMTAQSLETRQQAIAAQAARLEKLGPGTFISQNEVDLERARVAGEQARLDSERAKLAALTVAVGDCVLRAPFDGEVSARHLDPGGFARPQKPVATIVDRSIVRFTADAPETDFDVVAPGTRVRVRVYATGEDAVGVIARRTPLTDAETRTVRFEVDVPAHAQNVPANTTGEVQIDVGEPSPATEVPLAAASIENHIAHVFVVESGVAHTRAVPVRGEAGGSAFVDESLAAGTLVVTAGRTLLADGDRVDAKEAPK